MSAKLNKDRNRKYAYFRCIHALINKAWGYPKSDFLKEKKMVLGDWVSIIYTANLGFYLNSFVNAR